MLTTYRIDYVIQGGSVDRIYELARHRLVAAHNVVEAEVLFDRFAKTEYADRPFYSDGRPFLVVMITPSDLL